MNFGEKVRELREAKGLSQVELGRLIGVSYRNHNRSSARCTTGLQKSWTWM